VPILGGLTLPQAVIISANLSCRGVLCVHEHAYVAATRRSPPVADSRGHAPRKSLLVRYAHGRLVLLPTAARETGRDAM
jgi:hypothetical protein